MSCTGCGSDFGVFRKEIGCESCGFAFCSKCCTKRSFTAANSEKAKQQLCIKCFDQSNNKKSTYSPPLAHKKRMAAMASRSLSLGAAKHESYQNEKDKEIAERLQKLKRERTKEIVPNNEEIQERLAKLKGIDPSIYSAPPLMVFRPADRRTSSEQVTDLISQLTQEVQLDAKIIKPEDEIAARLAKLRGEPAPVKPKCSEDVIMPEQYVGNVTSPKDVDMMEVSKMLEEQHISATSDAMEGMRDLEKHDEYKKALEKMKDPDKRENSDEDDDEEEAEKIIRKLLDVNMEEDMGDPESLNSCQLDSPEDITDPKDSVDTEEFPWCTMCSENAKIRCFDCESDLYCLLCFKECHDSLDIKDHRTCPFLSPKK